jgi:hypothetical protein
MMGSKMEEVKHWSGDRYWTDALEAYYKLREDGQRELTLDLGVIEEELFNGDSPAYKAMEAMVSVWQQEGYEGHRGAPRVLLALLMRLGEISTNVKR